MKLDRLEGYNSNRILLSVVDFLAGRKNMLKFHRKMHD